MPSDTDEEEFDFAELLPAGATTCRQYRPTAGMTWPQKSLNSCSELSLGQVQGQVDPAATEVVPAEAHLSRAVRSRIDALGLLWAVIDALTCHWLRTIVERLFPLVPSIFGR